MKSSPLSTKHAHGMSRALALLMLLVFGFIEFALTVYMSFHGFRAAGLPVFILFLWNLSACIALTVYILSKGRPQQSGYMEVSNYLNLNKISNK
jgi:hypothetical protein